jgi:1-acyl-sn-glycerol-3-phosphate acyltransferase
MASTHADEAERARKLAAMPRYRPWFYDLVRGSSALILHTIFRLRVDGLENLPREGGIVLAPMHRSYIDTLAVGAALKKRRFRAMAKYELFFVPLIGRAIAMGGAFPVRRGVQDMEAYATAMRMLREGRLLLVFPEGTRNRHGKARPQLGAALLALDAGAAFVPIAIAGTDRFRLLPPRFPKVTVIFLEPIRLDDLPADDLRRASHAATKRWAAAVEAGVANLTR